jgi:hypothetical protein
MKLLQFQVNIKKKIMGSAIIRSLNDSKRFILLDYTVIHIMKLRRKQFHIVPKSSILGSVLQL